MAWLSYLGNWISGGRAGAEGVGDKFNHAEDSHLDQNPENSFDAHLDRNFFQRGLEPEHVPPSGTYTDPATGITWVSDDPRSEIIFHGGYDCFRGDFPDHMVAELRSDPLYRDAFAHMASGHGYAVETTEPGAHACYDQYGALVRDGPHQGTLDYASPAVPDQTWAHFHLDVTPDYHSDSYGHLESGYDYSNGFDDHGSTDPGSVGSSGVAGAGGMD